MNDDESVGACRVHYQLTGIIVAEQIAFDTVRPFPETKPSTTEYAVALKFKPQLYVRNGCLPYPAVDADGNTNEGLGWGPFIWSTKCNLAIYTSKNSQVYGRMAEYKGKWAIMYTWYFPKDTTQLPFYWGHRHDWENAIVWLDSLSENATIAAVSVTGIFGTYSKDAPPAPGALDESSVKVTYKHTIGTHHYLKVSTSPGLYQDLVMWDDMTEAARSVLETTDFNSLATGAASAVVDSASVEVQ